MPPRRGSLSPKLKPQDPKAVEEMTTLFRYVFDISLMPQLKVVGA